MPQTPRMVTLSSKRSDPMESARELIERKCTLPDGVVVPYWRGTFYHWNRTYYLALNDARVEHAIWKFLDGAVVKVYLYHWGVVKYQDFDPQKSHVSNVVAALEANAGISAERDAPCWLVPVEGFPVKQMVFFANGFYDLKRKQLYQYTRMGLMSARRTLRSILGLLNRSSGLVFAVAVGEGSSIH